jgi:polyphosphate kinase
MNISRQSEYRNVLINRELSLIEFNRRVLLEAEDNYHPLLERLKFISILSSNLDEFFMIRVAGLKKQISAEVNEVSNDGRTPSETLKEIRARLVPLYEMQSKILLEDILPALENAGVYIHMFHDLNKEEKQNLHKYFYNSVFPLLTPKSLDSAHPFPKVINRNLNVAFVLEEKHKKVLEKKVAFLQLPQSLPRLVPIDREEGFHFVLLEQVIKAHADNLFPGLHIVASHTFRVTRDADIEIADDEAEDLIEEIEEQVKHRSWGTAAVKLEVSPNMPNYLVKLLTEYLELEPTDVYYHNRPLNLPDFMKLLKLDLPKLKDIPFQSRVVKELVKNDSQLFYAIKKKDFLLHHPFDSFSNSTLRFVNAAASDPSVQSIKITLYRTGMNSGIVEALKQAALNGKQVTAFVELKARFDEENNIIWAKDLEEYGCHVVYGVIGLKTHCKICAVARQEGEKIKMYLHLSTGNYNQVTSRLYTDVALLTSRDEYALDAIHLFNYLTGYSNYKDWEKFMVAPINLESRIIDMINREAENHTEEKPGLIIAKMNSLSETNVINALIKASQKGVKIKLLIRGICCIKPGIVGVTENIEIKSILGRFLEHSRVFYFQNCGQEEVFLSSADWMSRNLKNRVEIMFPILDKNHKNYLIELLKVYWRDNKKSWQLLPDGNYEKIIPKDGEDVFIAQDYFIKEAKSTKRYK